MSSFDAILTRDTTLVIADGAPRNGSETCLGALSIFDLDRTLTRRGTYSPFLLFCAWRSAPWRLALVPAALLAMIAYKLAIIDRVRLKNVMQHLMIGAIVRRDAVDRLAGAFARRCAEQDCYKEGFELIAREKAQGREVVLATAAHDFYAAAIADRLGIAHVVATGSHWDGDRLTARIAGANCYGPAKRDALVAFLARQGLARGEAHVRFYSDDVSDLPTFEWSDEAIAVNPSAKLAAVARQRGWPLLRWGRNGVAGCDEPFAVEGRLAAA